LHKLGHKVEIFEMSAKDEATRPRQMEGSVHLLQNVPEIESHRYMKKIELHSPNVTASGNGNLGFFYEVGGTNGIDARARRDIEKLLPIHYSKKIENKKQLQPEFDVVIAADGYHSAFAREAGILVSRTPKEIGVGLGFTVKGDFDPEFTEIWLDNYFSLHGYLYVIPFSNFEASLVSVSFGKNINQTIYRERLKELAQLRAWQLQDAWVDYEIWYDFSSYAKDNLYVVGNAGSFVESALGFGLKWAIKSAKLCAKAIHENIDYNILVSKELFPELESFKFIRTFFEAAKDKDYDKFVKTFKNPLVKKMAESGKSLFKNARLMQMLFPKIKARQHNAHPEDFG